MSRQTTYRLRDIRTGETLVEGSYSAFRDAVMTLMVDGEDAGAAIWNLIR